MLLFLSSPCLPAEPPLRYASEVFPDYELRRDVVYGEAVGVDGRVIPLLLDTYTPVGDTIALRPLVIFIHGGGFQNGDKVGRFSTLVCGGLARRGYLAASMNYRLTPAAVTPAERFEAMIRAVQDARAAVRFFRRYAREYNVDTSRIFMTGSSAGAMTALHLAYLDEEEIPWYVSMKNVGGTLEGASGNPGWPSRVHGIVNNWGAIGDYRWIRKGDVPVYSVHGTSDPSVPYDSSATSHPFRYGSAVIHQRALELGIPTGLRLFPGAGHTLDNNRAKQDSALADFSAWLFTVQGTRCND